MTTNLRQHLRPIQFLIAGVALWACPCPAAIHSTHPAPVVDPSIPVPTITFDSMSYNFGKIMPGKAVVHSYVVTNTGKAVLHIEDIKAICGCTSTIVGRRDLAPGEITQIQATFLPENGFTGEVRKTIVVTSNDPARPKLTLRFSASVVGAANAETKEQ